MSDVLTPEQRHMCMSKIKGKNTTPELIVRSWLHCNGYRFRIQKADLPGKPDIVLKKYNLVLFINGCYWHRHPGCKFTTTPSTNLLFWEKKFYENVQRDQKNYDALKALGWNVLVIWECQVKDKTFIELLNNYFIEYK